MNSSPIASPLALNYDEIFPKNVIYLGQSMQGTFRNGDCLHLEPIAFDDIRLGDILVYQKLGIDDSPQTDRIAHRVVAIAPGSILLRGDCNPKHDSHFLNENDLIGRVTHFERNGTYRQVYGGRIGFLRGKSLHIWYFIKRVVWWGGVLCAGPFYRYLKRTGLIARLWKPVVVKATFQTDKGPMIKYLVRGRAVAVWFEESDTFWVKRPYDHVISKPE